MQYGIGTYISELIVSLENTQKLNIYLVSYKNPSVNKLNIISKTESFHLIDIPSPNLRLIEMKDYDRKYAAAVINLLAVYIPEKDVVFQLNYIDDLEIGKVLTERFDYPVISVVHFAQYQQLFNGNKRKLEGLNINNPSDNIEFTLFTEKELYRISDHIVSVTSYMKEFLSEYYNIDPEKITVIPNGLDHSKYEKVSKEERRKIRSELGFDKNDTICLFSGRVDQCKGVGFLLPAFEEACKTNYNLKLVLLGQGNLNEFQTHVKSAYGKIIYTGFLPGEQVKKFYQIADIGIIPSIYDHCPYTALEMIAGRVPLIISRIDGLNEILDDSECVFINPVPDDTGEINYNINELSELILKLAGDEKIRKKYSENAFRKLMLRNTSSGMAESMFGIFQDLNKINEPKSI